MGYCQFERLHLYHSLLVRCGDIFPQIVSICLFFFSPKRNKNLFVPVTKLISLTSLLHFESNEHKLSMALGLGADGVTTPCALKYQYAILPRWTSQHMTNHDALTESHRFGVACAARLALTATTPLADLDQVTFLHTARDVLPCHL